ncbi:MAG: glutathione peroxidase [Phycisphaerae bacterium]|nr:glutathione peroxidase [Phycisphaerae bacterium]
MQRLRIPVVVLLAVATWFFVGALRLHAAPSAAARHRKLSVYSFTMKSLGGKTVHLSQYRGKVIFLVNTASKCGFTPQYAGLEKLYKTYAGQGLVILGFPSNDFGHQEPGTAKQISTFCTVHYGVTFPMFAKIDVKGPHQCALYRYLTWRNTDPQFAGVVRWNFEKFLISRKGRIVARFRSAVKPESAIVVAAIKKQLAK